MLYEALPRLAQGDFRVMLGKAVAHHRHESRIDARKPAALPYSLSLNAHLFGYDPDGLIAHAADLSCDRACVRVCFERRDDFGAFFRRNPASLPSFEAPRAHMGLAADARSGLSINIERTGKANGIHSKRALA